MANSYRRGPLCSVAQSPSFFNDGIENSVPETNLLYYDDTESMGMLSQRGPIGEDLSTTPGSEPLSTSGLNTLLWQIRQAVNSIELEDHIVTLLGPQCFTTGVIVGIGMDILNSVNELLKLVQMFVLAELHDRATDGTNWWQFGSIGMTGLSGMASMMIAQTVAGTFFSEELREAAKERDVFIKELGEAFSDPKALFDNITNAMAESYKKDWQDYNRHMNADTLEGRFRAGMICGRVLVGILGLLTGIIGLGKVSAKLVSKLPQLVKMAKTVKINPSLYKKPQQSIGAQGSNVSTAQTPAEVTAVSSEAKIVSDGFSRKKSVRIGTEKDRVGISRTAFGNSLNSKVELEAKALISKGELDGVALSRTGVSKLNIVSDSFKNIPVSIKQGFPGIERFGDKKQFIRITDQNAYIDRIEALYAKSRNPLNSSMRDRILNHVPQGAEFPLFDPNGVKGIPSLHAEVQSANSVLNQVLRGFNVGDIQVSTFKLQNSPGQGTPFSACGHCGGILNGFDILTGH